MDRFRTLQIVWIAMMSGVVVFATVVYLVLTLGDVQLAEGFPPLVLRVLAPTAVVTMGAGLLVRRKLLDAIPRGAQPADRVSRYRAAVITGLAMIEGPGLLIIVLSLVAGTSSWIPAGTAATILMMVIARPRRDEVETTR